VQQVPVAAPDDPAVDQPAVQPENASGSITPPSSFTSFNSGIIKQNRQRGKLFTVIIFILVGLAIFGLVFLWLSLGSPTNIDQVNQK
jgi:hypothetical protein